MKHRKSVARPLAVATVSSALFIVTGFGSYAVLTAEVENPSGQAVSTGTLRLALADNGQGFSQVVSGLAPGDTVNRFVQLTNSGTIPGDTLTLKITPTGDPSLISDGTSSKALTIAVTSCSVPWDPATGECGGTTQDLTPSPLSLSGFSLPAFLGSGTFAPDATKNLRISLSLPDQNETTVNGNPPTETVQGKTVSVAYTFGVTQRSATTTNQ